MLLLFGRLSPDHRLHNDAFNRRANRAACWNVVEVAGDGNSR